MENDKDIQASFALGVVPTVPAPKSAAPAKAATPLMQQYLELKSKHPQDILLFRLGDFYELFDEDARRAAPILEVTLTQRQGQPMCGVPAHSIEPYIAKLLKAGQRVAIADQMEDPSTAKGIVKRSVVRVMTAGTLQEDTLLPSRRCNYLAALTETSAGVGLSAIECSTGEFIATEITGAAARTKAWDELMRLGPSEVVLPASTENMYWKDRLASQGIAVSELSVTDFSAALAEERLKSIFQTASVRGFGLEKKPLALSASGAVARYLENTQCGRPTALRSLRTYDIHEHLQMDANTIDHLDLLPKGANYSGKPTSLLEVIDNTLTPMGARLLRRWVIAPLREVHAILERQDKVEFFYESKEGRRTIRALLQGWPDLERILTRMTSGSAGPRDYAALGQGLRRLPKIKSQLQSLLEQTTKLGRELPAALSRFMADFPEENALSSLLDISIVEAPPATLKEGGVIKPGFDSELDEVRSWIHTGKNRLLELETQEREQTGIPSLKIGFNNVFGYYIEVTKTHLSKVPMHYIRKQTTAGGERYITPELKDFETRILGAEERALRLENVLLASLRDQILGKTSVLQGIALTIAELDVFIGLAEIADRHRYTKPVIDESDTLMIREGRHPVLEEVLPSGTLVPNDVMLNASDPAILILTGPNMSGKSTYLRQTALIAILAQMGSYVPAAEARVGIIDQLFTRIGASDRLSEGESTFMVEMVETARILNHATPRSLVILDEVGRGTSTYDGISIAWSCLEYLRKQGPKVLFATHYFEITQLAQQLPGVTNAHVSAREWGDQVVFLHKVENGPGDRSFGIHVAKLAGVPKPVLERAEALLQEFERSRDKSQQKAMSRQPLLFTEEGAPGNDPLENDRVSPSANEGITPLPAWIEEFHQLDLNQLTPLQALMKLQEWKEKKS